MLVDGTIVVGYYDLRDAIKAMKVLKRTRYFNERLLLACFTTRERLACMAPEVSRMFLGTNNGEVVIGVARHGRVSQDIMYSLFSSHGDVKTFRYLDTAADPNDIIVCQYYDIRDAGLAIQLDGKLINGCQLLVEFYNETAVERQSSSIHAQRSRSHLLDTQGMRNESSRLLYSPSSLPLRSAIGGSESRNHSPIVGAVFDRLPKSSRDGSANLCNSTSLGSASDLENRHIRRGINGAQLSAPLARAGFEQRGSWSFGRPSRNFESYFELPTSAAEAQHVTDPESPPDSERASSIEDRQTPVTSPYGSPLSALKSRSDFCTERARSSLQAPSPLRQDVATLGGRSRDVLPGSPASSPSLAGLASPRNKVEFGAIARGRDARTTLMIKNIPVRSSNSHSRSSLTNSQNKITQEGLKEWVDQT